uniref:UDP glucuronosyltransferase 5 family, polypeptide D1 n=1 Tax=Acanthochromis polyacanthus TaxID=80966 RepID=A0A3Q1ECK5_9TELE
MKILLEELHARGHNLTVIREGTSRYIPEKSPLYTSIKIDLEKDLVDFFDDYLQEHVKMQREGASLLTHLKVTMNFISILSQANSLWADATIKIFEDQNIMKSFIDSKYDLVLTDPGFASGLVLAKYLNLPLVLNVRWITSGDGHFVLAPSPLSYIPVPGSGLTDKMNFIQRVQNVLYHGIILFQQKFMVGPCYETLCNKYIEGGCDTISLLQEADIWLFRTNFVFDFPRPTMPNMVYIGGFQCKPAQPLPADLEDFVQGAGEHGVIIMSLGALIQGLPKEVANEIGSVFAKLPQKVIWRHKGERPSTLGNNTLIVDWMPQKDLLGHPQTRVFVLVFPVDGSHWINMKILLEELHVRGHNLTVIREANSWYIPEKSPLYTSITLDLKEGFEDMFDAFVQEHMKMQREGASILTFFKVTTHFLSLLAHGHSLWTDATIKMFEDQNIMNN